MKATVRGFHSPDADLDSFQPPRPEHFSLFLQMFVGPEGGRGEESFDLTICTPSWLQSELRQSSGPLWGLNLLIVDAWDAPKIFDYLSATVAAVQGSDWTEVTSKISRLAKWEFQDYVPFDGG